MQLPRPRVLVLIGVLGASVVVGSVAAADGSSGSAPAARAADPAESLVEVAQGPGAPTRGYVSKFELDRRILENLGNGVRGIVVRDIEGNRLGYMISGHGFVPNDVAERWATTGVAPGPSGIIPAPTDGRPLPWEAAAEQKPGG